MKLYAARHGQTQYNAEEKVCGITDLPLTKTGLAQAQQLARSLADKDIDIIISSPMLRARQTAQAVAQLTGAPVITDSRIREQNYGIFEGANRKDSGFLAAKRQFVCRYPGGESMFQVAARVYSLIDEVKEKYSGKNVLLVCHGGVCRVIKTYFEDMTNKEYALYSPSNAFVAEYDL